jgi:cation:H+ antiporter
MTGIESAVARLLTGFLLVAVGSALFSHAAERLIGRFFSNRQLGARILGNVSLSLPEAVLPLFAFLSTDRNAGTGPDLSMEIGVGAVLGAPAFLLLVLWPLYLWHTRRHALPSSRRRQLVREIPLLGAALGGALLLGLLNPPWLKVSGGILLLGLYVVLFFRIESHPGEPPETSAGDTASPGTDKEDPARIGDAIAFLSGTGLILYGPDLFLSGLRELSGQEHAATPFLLSLFLSALATESPEMLALLIFLRKGERALGFDIVWGSISFQLTVSLSIGLFLSPWTLSGHHLILGALLLLVLGSSYLYGRRESHAA